MSSSLEEVSDILLSNTLTEPDSSDPEGDLFYDDFSKLSGPVDYRFWYNTVTDDEEAAVVAQFHLKGSDIFVAEVGIELCLTFDEL
jgi:hypothetical protein